MPLANFETGLKVCSKCGQEKPLSEFGKNAHTVDKLQNRCRTCVSEYGKMRRKTHPEEVKAVQKRYHETHLEQKRRYSREYRKTHCEARRDHQRTVVHGMLRAQFDKFVAAQGDACFICRTPKPGGRGGWHVDHGHASEGPGKHTMASYRALLCATCNKQLGVYEKRKAEGKFDTYLAIFGS